MISIVYMTGNDGKFTEPVEICCENFQKNVLTNDDAEDGSFILALKKMEGFNKKWITIFSMNSSEKRKN